MFQKNGSLSFDQDSNLTYLPQRKPTKHITLTDAVEGYVLALRVENKSPRTVEVYTDALKQLSGFVGADIPVASLTTRRLQEWVLSLQNRQTRKGTPLSPFSVSIYVRAVKAFLSWCVAEGFLDKAPGLKTPKVPKKQPDTLSNEDILTLLREAKKVSPRVYALVHFLLDTGCRAQEVCNMRVADVNLEEGTAVVRGGKGKKDRTVQCGVETAKALWVYLKVRRTTSAYLFADRTGGKLTYNALLQVVRRLGKRAGKADLHPHTFRHTFATAYLAAGGSVTHCQVLMGHESVTTTMGYVNLAEIRSATKKISVVEDALKQG